MCAARLSFIFISLQKAHFCLCISIQPNAFEVGKCSVLIPEYTISGCCLGCIPYPHRIRVRPLLLDIRIGQTVPKWIKRLSIKKAVGSPLHAVICKWWQILHASIKCDWQATAGRYPAKQNISQCIPSFCSGIKSLQNRRASFILLPEINTASGYIYQYHRLSRI